MTHSAQEHPTPTRGAASIFPKDLPGEKVREILDDLLRRNAEIEPCYGVVHRAYDYPEGPYRDQFDIDERHRSARVIAGTKIGGIPWWHQDEETMPGVHLCTLAPVRPHFGDPYPFVNVEEAASSDTPYVDRLMTWGNWETVYVFVDDHGSISWVIQYT
jgi:hypothetical protein